MNFKQWALATVLLAFGAGAMAQDVEPLHGNGGSGVWQRIDAQGEITGLDGKKHKASCSGFPGTDKRFSFWTREGRSRNLVIYFEGGGACWDGASCSYPVTGGAGPQFFVPQVPPGTDPATMDGIFKRDNPANPVADWDMVYIPYCTGDIHVGSASTTYASVGNPALGIPPGTPITIEHRGFDNFMHVMHWVQRNIRQPRKLLVAGSSAGGYGATANAAWVARLFPGSRMHVLADASQGVTLPGFDEGNPGRLSWNPQWFKRTFGTGGVASIELMRKAAQGDRDARFAQFTTAFDGVQIQFYGAMVQGGYGAPSCPNLPVDWHNQASRQLTADAADLRNYRHYVAAGSYHTLLRSPQFYAETSAGPVFADWVNDFLGSRGRGHRDGSHWKNEACPGCLAQLACP
jgi:Pectinacetylesterase